MTHYQDHQLLQVPQMWPQNIQKPPHQLWVAALSTKGRLPGNLTPSLLTAWSGRNFQNDLPKLAKPQCQTIAADPWFFMHSYSNSFLFSYLQLAASRFDICNFTKCDPIPAFTVGLAWGPVGPRWELTVNRTLLRQFQYHGRLSIDRLSILPHAVACHWIIQIPHVWTYIHEVWMRSA